MPLKVPKTLRLAPLASPHYEGAEVGALCLLPQLRLGENVMVGGPGSGSSGEGLLFSERGFLIC